MVDIYALADAEGVRYVGYSVAPKRRYAQHLSRAHKERNLKARWIADLLSGGSRPELVILEEGVGAQDRWRAERRWIAHYRETGLLLNNTVGGEGHARLYVRQDVTEALRRHSPAPLGLTYTEWRERKLKPSASVIIGLFDTWDAALEAAELEPPGQRWACGHRRQRGAPRARALLCPECSERRLAEQAARREYIVREYLAGASLKEVARALGLRHHQSVLAVLAEAGIERRPRRPSKGRPNPYKGRSYRCGRCGELGHNARSCA